MKNKKAYSPVIIFIIMILIIIFVYQLDKYLQNDKNLKACNLEKNKLLSQIDSLINENSQLKNKITSIESELIQINTTLGTNLIEKNSSWLVSYIILDRSINLDVSYTNLFYLVTSVLSLIILIPLTIALRLQSSRTNRGILYILFWIFDILTAIYLIFSIIQLLPFFLGIISQFFR